MNFQITNVSPEDVDAITALIENRHPSCQTDLRYIEDERELVGYVLDIGGAPADHANQVSTLLNDNGLNYRSVTAYSDPELEYNAAFATCLHDGTVTTGDCTPEGVPVLSVTALIEASASGRPGAVATLIANTGWGTR